MSSTNKTTYYDLPQFVDSDLFNPLVDDNDAYDKIDTALHNIADAEADDASEIVGVKSRVTTAEGKIEALETQNGIEVLSTTAQTLSGAVNELDADVASLDGRLDVVEDDIDNENTGLKVKVADLGTRMTTAEGDIDALETQNGSAVLKTVAQTLSGAINENFDKIATYGTIYTPEMFGAVGDGVADDTEAVQNAINAGRCCIINKSYKTTSPISISSHKFVIINGTIHYTGNDNAITISSDAHIHGLGTIISDGSSVITNNWLPTHFAIIEGLTLRCETADAHVVKFESSGQSVSNVRMTRIRIETGGDATNPVAESGIYIHTTDEGYINENHFEQIHFSGCNFAIKMLLEASHHMNRNQFIQVTSENCAHALYAYSPARQYNISGNVFDFRTEEWNNRVDQIQIDEMFRSNILYGRYLTSHFLSLGDTPVTTALSEYSVHQNHIIGRIRYANNEGNTFNDPVFRARGNDVMFDLQGKHHSGFTVAEDGVTTLDYSGVSNHSAGYKIYRINQTALTINLNNKSNYFFSPMRYVKIGASAGCDLTIVDGNTTVLATTHLAQGYHELTYTSPTEMAVLY